MSPHSPKSSCESSHLYSTDRPKLVLARSKPVDSNVELILGNGAGDTVDIWPNLTCEKLSVEDMIKTLKSTRTNYMVDGTTLQEILREYKHEVKRRPRGPRKVFQGFQVLAGKRM